MATKDIKTSVVIIGAGEIGRAIEKVLTQKSGVGVKLWDKDILKVAGQKPLAEIVPSADFVFLCVPSWAIKEAVVNFLSLLSGKTIIISLAKGIDKLTNKTMDKLLKEFLPAGQGFALLGGPMLAEELGQGKGGVAAIGAESESLCVKIKELFKNTAVKVECFNDIYSVALAGVLKNIYAISLGIADGLLWSGNQKGFLTATAINEMAEIISALGGKKEIVYSSAGLGDLIATGYSLYSRHRQVGEELVKTGKCYLKNEGFSSLTPLLNLLGKKKKQFPLLLALEKIIIKNQNLKIVFEKLIK